MKKYIITIDQGTTSTRAILWDKKGKKVACKQLEFKQIMPRSGWVQHNPEEIFLTVKELINQVMNEADCTADEIDSIGITNQRETTVVFDKRGKSIYPAIVWQSRQTIDICDRLEADGYKDLIHSKTGLLINPYFSATKVMWILENVPGAKEQAERGNLLCGTIDTYVLYRLTEGRSFKTDVTNACRTMMYNINDLCWDKELLDIYDIPESMLAEVCDNACDFGYTTLFGSEIKICAMIGDQQSSLFGHTAFNQGDTKITYGTGSFMLMNTGSKAVYSKNGLLSTIAWRFNNETTYALEGSVFVAGSAIQWLRDGLKIIKKSSETYDMATRVEDSLGVYFVPSFVGLGTPYWDSECRGAIFGLSRGTNKDHIARATLEGIAYQVSDVINCMKDEAGTEINTACVDGGASANDYLMQFQSDVTRLTLERPRELETTALGACYMAGLYTGFFNSMEQIKKFHELDQMFLPEISERDAKKLLKGWKVAVEATRMFKVIDDENDIEGEKAN